MGKDKQNATICLVYNSIMQSNLRLLLYISMVTIIIISLSGIVTPVVCFLCIPLLFCAAKLSCFGVFSSEGIEIHTFFTRPFFLPWETVMHYGTITKKSKFQTINYIYFSVKALVSAPYEPMPKLSNSSVYFTLQPRLKSALMQNWDCAKTKKLIPDLDDKKHPKKSMLHFCVGFYFVWLFRVLFALTDNHIWLYLMVMPSIYIFIGVIWTIHKTDG